MEDRIYGLLGRKLGHSYSPAIHAQLGDAAYRCIELEPDQLGEFLKRDDIGGLNVTIPYKRDVLPFCTWTSESVRQIGAANTLLYGDDPPFRHFRGRGKSSGPWLRRGIPRSQGGA